MENKLKLSRREIAALANQGVVRQNIDGSIEQTKAQAAPPPKKDNKNRSWKVDGIERDWEGYITSVVITETTP